MEAPARVDVNEGRLVDLQSLPDDVLLSISSFAGPRDLLCLQCVSNRFARDLDTDGTWKALCDARWRDWPRYRLTPNRLAWLDKNLPAHAPIRTDADDLSHCRTFSGRCWKGRYLWAERDVVRTEFKNTEEVEGLGWSFNFTPSAGGMGRDSLCRCEFRGGFLFVAGYPPLPYELVSGSPPPSTLPSDQWMRIHTFPPHCISRSASDGEWIISNENVIMKSCDDSQS